jgi:hypothetical protein
MWYNRGDSKPKDKKDCRNAVTTTYIEIKTLHIWFDIPTIMIDER